MTKHQKITKELENFFIKKEGKKILKNIKNKNLMKEGLIDSLDVLTICSLLQKKFNYKVDLSSSKVLKSFESFENIVKLVK